MKGGGPHDYVAEREEVGVLKAFTVTDVEFTGQPRNNFLSYVSVVINGSLRLTEMRLVLSKAEPRKMVLAMPARQGGDGGWVEIYHPLTKNMRGALEDEIFRRYAERHAKR